ncbi:hypothetical protein NLC35_03250 [Candidatus Aminicenantes bacterium AC-334-K16]|jgi:hypothetical protein|nr:hypothetical protein [Candidatus Aminicenantes bacterium AC-334-K16]
MVPFFLLVLNIILLAISWIMLVYAYPRLPADIPLWLALGGDNFLYPKSLLIFLYPLGETLFNLLFLKLARVKLFSKQWKSSLDKTPPSPAQSKERLRIEFAFLAMIFFNLIFIHVERSLILVAHRVEKGVNPFYFLMLFLVLLMLIPYYRIREIAERKQWLIKSKKRKK